MGRFRSSGPKIWLFKKKNLDRSIDLALCHIYSTFPHQCNIDLYKLTRKEEVVFNFGQGWVEKEPFTISFSFLTVHYTFQGLWVEHFSVVNVVTPSQEKDPTYANHKSVMMIMVMIVDSLSSLSTINYDDCIYIAVKRCWLIWMLMIITIAIIAEVLSKLASCAARALAAPYSEP